MNPVVEKVAKAITAELKNQAYVFEGTGYLVVDGDVDTADLARAAIEALGLTEMVNSIPSADG